MAANSSSESADSTLKRRARRRLIGAIALVVSAVIALPMIFDAEKKPLEQDVSIHIPDQDAIVVKPSGGVGAVSKSVAPREPKSLEPPKVDPAKAVMSRVDTSRSEAPKAEPTQPVKEVSKADKAGSRAEANAEPKADVTGVPAKAEAARVKALLSDKAEAAAPTKDGFAVQVGAFATEEKVREARERLSVSGIKTYIEKLDSKDGERTRVRAGPFPGREAAEAAREQIRGLGFAGAAVVQR